MPVVEIDGSRLEGGGQIIRTAVAMSAVSGKPLHIFNIRANRKQPGLKTQHLEGIKAIATLCGGELKGAVLGSKEIFFRPGKLQPKPLEITISTAGSIGLIFQSLKLPAAQAGKPVTVHIKGGATFGKWSPPVPYTQNVLIPILEKMGYKAEIKINRHGFYPKGGADVTMTIQPFRDLKPLKLLKVGKVKEIEGMSIASTHLQKARVAERQAQAAATVLKQKGLKGKITPHYVDSVCPGSGITLWAKMSDGSVIGADGLGERGKPSEKVGKEAATKLLSALRSGTAVDPHLSDQILPMMAFAPGTSSILVPEVTMHAKTNMWVIQKFRNVGFQSRSAEKGLILDCFVL
ncbi:MAG: RNA 3'-terminal phosphate cyclase [Candidatus Aenigmarchaeota archaeon]